MDSVAASNVPERTVAARVAGLALLASGALSVAMVATLAAMFAGFAAGARDVALRMGAVNDALAIAVYGLALPTVAVMHMIVRETGTTRSLVLATTGAVGIVVTMVLQWLLVTGALTFEQQIGPVSIALLAVGAWMVGTGYLARSTGYLPDGVRTGLLGAFYVGYPVWAVRLGRRLLAGRTAA